MIVKSSLRPVRCVIECSCGTSWVRFKPSGVSSNAQANASARANPRTTSRTRTRKTQAGAPNDGRRKDAACSAIQPTTA